MSVESQKFLPLVIYLLTGTAVTTVSQMISNKVNDSQCSRFSTPITVCSRSSLSQTWHMIVSPSFLQHFTEDSVQALACVKYISTLAVSFADSTFRSRPHADAKASGPANTPAKQALQRQLILVIGCIDVLAYAAFCTGFAYCDGAVATLLLAGGGQIFTAILSKYVLKKPLSRGQVLGVRFLLLMRAN